MSLAGHSEDILLRGWLYFLLPPILHKTETTTQVYEIMQPTISQPFQVLSFSGISVPVYGSAAEPLFAVADIGAIYGDATLKSTAKNDSPAPYSTWLYTTNSDGDVLYTQLFTRLGLCQHVFTSVRPKTSTLIEIREWVLAAFDGLAAASRTVDKQPSPCIAIDANASPTIPVAGACFSARIDRLEQRMNAMQKAISL